MTAANKPTTTAIIVGDLINATRFSLENEKYLQKEIGEVLTDNSIAFEREKRLNDRDIPDFFIDGLAIEVKIKGTPMNIYRQCERYCKHDEVKSLLLLTTKSMLLPDTINSKPCFVLNLAKAWL